ncbi:MAG: hypothetical protein ACI95C_001953 [Pseudohongiellaceae bacterium]|jgi:hypothetical protein
MTASFSPNHEKLQTFCHLLDFKNPCLSCPTESRTSSVQDSLGASIWAMACGQQLALEPMAAKHN